MPVISQQSFQQAFQDAQTVGNHGRRFEQIARSLEGRVLTRAQAEVIENAGRQIQQHSQKMTALIERSLKEIEEARQEDEPNLLEQYALIHQQQCEALLLYSVAIEVLVQASKTALLLVASLRCDQQ